MVRIVDQSRHIYQTLAREPNAEELDKGHDLVDFMSQVSHEMASEYTRIQRRAIDDPGTARDQGEENWAEFLRDWLPATYDVVTKGRLISYDGRTSPQLDILVLKDSYPKKLKSKKLYLAHGVAAAFECKTTLKSSHFRKIMKTSAELKSFFPAPITGSPYKELHAPFVFGVLAHPHNWKKVKSNPLKRIDDCLFESDQEHLNHPRETLDLLCVADLATWVSLKMVYHGPIQDYGYKWNLSRDRALGSISTGYLGHTKENTEQVPQFTPIGALITLLFSKLAWTNQEMTALAKYYSYSGICGVGSGAMRDWDISLYSEELRETLYRRKYDATPDNWKNEWQHTF